MAANTRWLRHTVDGTIYRWNAILAQNPKCEEVSEEEAFPEKFIPKKQVGRKTKLALETDVVDTEDEPTGSPALAAEASKGL